MGRGTILSPNLKLKISICRKWNITEGVFENNEFKCLN